YCAPSGLYQNLAYCKKIVVSAVTGHCPSAGSMLVLCSDYTVCASDSRFEAPFASLPEASLVLAALTLRLNRAKAWMLGGQPWDAPQALHAGLVNRVTDSAQVATQAQTMAAAAAKMPLDGIAMSKLLVEAFLDTQGVGQDFDMAGLYADALHRALPGLTPGTPA
ncbi:MAG: enoyl-CoA hydratase/isomerase family protein, partial [Burkholderiaceae bacterium]|nr:enoyl-CoA hydratase/isomerase family protein [Burkholderiaceae bacterium]